MRCAWGILSGAAKVTEVRLREGMLVVSSGGEIAQVDSEHSGSNFFRENRGEMCREGRSVVGREGNICDPLINMTSQLIVCPLLEEGREEMSAGQVDGEVVERQCGCVFAATTWGNGVVSAQLVQCTPGWSMRCA